MRSTEYLNLAPPLKVLAEHKSTREILADLSLFSVADVGFRRGLRGRWSEEGCSTPEYKKMGGRALPRLAINEVLPTNLLGVPRSAGVSWRGQLGAASGGSASSMEDSPGTWRRRKR